MSKFDKKTIWLFAISASLFVFLLNNLSSFKPRGLLKIKEENQVALIDLEDKTNLIEAVKHDCAIDQLAVDADTIPVSPDNSVSVIDLILRGIMVQCRLGILTGEHVKSVEIKVHEWQPDLSYWNYDELKSKDEPLPYDNPLMPSLTLELIADGKTLKYRSNSLITKWNRGKLHLRSVYDPNDTSESRNAIDFESDFLEDILAGAPVFFVRKFPSIRQIKSRRRLFSSLCGFSASRFLSASPISEIPNFFSLSLPTTDFFVSDQIQTPKSMSDDGFPVLFDSATATNGSGLFLLNFGHDEHIISESIFPIVYSANNGFHGDWAVQVSEEDVQKYGVEGIGLGCSTLSQKALQIYNTRYGQEGYNYSCVKEPMNLVFQRDWHNFNNDISVGTIYLTKAGKIHTLSVISKPTWGWPTDGSVDCFNNISQASLDWRD